MPVSATSRLARDDADMNAAVRRGNSLIFLEKKIVENLPFSVSVRVHDRFREVGVCAGPACSGRRVDL